MQEEYEIYGGFAFVYDEFMDNIPYDAWYEYLHGLLKEYGISDGIRRGHSLWNRRNHQTAVTGWL